jgi:hypothetical protein
MNLKFDSLKFKIFVLHFVFCISPEQLLDFNSIDCLVLINYNFLINYSILIYLRYFLLF